MTWIFTTLIALLFLLVTSAVKILPEYERGVVFRLGRIRPVRGPGLVFLIPGIERLVRISLRLIVLDVEKQEVITRDNVSIRVNAVVYFRVVDPVKAVLAIEDFFFATSQLAQTTLRSVAGQAELDELLAERDQINQRLQEILDQHTEAWGIKVTQVEVKHIDLPVEMQRAMARQAEAERERRAKVIAATGELQASAQLTEAASVMEQHPVSVQLRFLQTLIDVAAENNSTMVFPVPVDLFKPYLDAMNRDKDDPKGPTAPTPS